MWGVSTERVAVIEFGADTRPSTDIPPADPQVVQGDIKAGPGVTCQGFAPPPAPGPAAPTAPEPAAEPAPAPAPVARKVAAPKPAVVLAPVTAPVVVAPPVAPPVVTPSPPLEPPVVTDIEPVEVYETTAAVADPAPIALEAVAVYEQTGVMLIAGFFGTMLLISLALAMVAGGNWHKRQLAKVRT